MPQMEFADYAPQVVWLVITFAVFYFLMARFAIPGVERVLTAREDRIQGDLNRAQALGQQAVAARVERPQPPDVARGEPAQLAVVQPQHLRIAAVVDHLQRAARRRQHYGALGQPGQRGDPTVEIGRAHV